MKKYLVLMLLTFFLFAAYNTWACSAFFLCRDSVKVLSRNHDFKTERGYVRVHRKGIDRKAKLFDKKGIKNIESAVWRSKYDNITFHAEEKPNIYMPIGGINSEGLAIVELYVDDDNTANLSFKKTKQAIMCSQWVGYVLDNYKNVNEMMANITNLRLINNFHAHWLACDKSGNSAVIEYINGNLTISYGQPLTISGITNHSYNYSFNELKKYLFLGGKKELPQGHKSIERFIRGAYKLHKYNKGNPVQYMLELMKNVARPSTTDSPTQWVTIYDLENRKIYYRVRHDKKLHTIDFDEEIKKPNGTIIKRINANVKKETAKT
jgi:penicillin V acylase-like amidase (Ntn superfamily)